MVSEFENISLSDVWELPTLQFLNDLVYIKLKTEMDADYIRTKSKQTSIN